MSAAAWLDQCLLPYMNSVVLGCIELFWFVAVFSLRKYTAVIVLIFRYGSTLVLDKDITGGEMVTVSQFFVSSV